ncbi:MAG: 1-deoxy-D-xylulose-5-phosphate reductoisomerase, partial [Comamonas sp.]|nr:1-deoxy-D-xylulose-5-phosphate reductoisomerase [Comamonas sp.]
QRVDHIILTASGGPFRTREPSSLRDVTPQQACNHPNFAMGRKISIDSATMMNKALEVIEARWLFNLQPDQIKVVIHPQQIVHSMVQFRDASVLAQLGTPDMRVPIACGLAWPERVASGAAPLDFVKLSALTFEEADAVRFPGLHLSWQALRAPHGTTTVLNAANEVAVAAFLDGRMRFDQIYQVNAQALEGVQPQAPDSIDALLALDAEVRAYTEGLISELAV